MFDLLDYDRSSGIFRWKGARGNRRAGSPIERADKRDGYIRIQINGTSYLAHRLAWLFVYNEWPNGILDHRNGIRTDNRIENLRLATRAQNTQNSKGRRDSQSGAKGVGISGRKWRARITVGGRSIYLGTFDTKEAASVAYDTAAQKHFGDFSHQERRI